MAVQEFKFTFGSKDQSTTNTKEFVKILAKLEKTLAAQKKESGADKDMSALMVLLGRLVRGIEKQQESVGKQLNDVAKQLKIEQKPIGSKDDPKIQVLSDGLKSIENKLAKLYKDDRPAKFDINDVAKQLKIKKEDLSKKFAIIDLETGPFKTGGKPGNYGGKTKVDFITQVGILEATLNDILTKTTAQLEAQIKKINIKPPVATKSEYNKIYEDAYEDAKKEAVKKHRSVPKKFNNQISFDDLTKGVSLEAAMKEVGEILKDSAVIAGHNIQDFDSGVIKDALKEAKVNIDFASKEFYDTLVEARKMLPARKDTHGLETIKKDLELIGKQYKGAAHQASTDVAVTSDVMKVLAGTSIDLNDTMGKVSVEASKLFDSMTKAEKAVDYIGHQAKKSADKLAALAPTAQATGESLEELDIQANKAAKITADFAKKAKINIDDLSKVRSMQAAVFKEAVVHPTSKSFDVMHPKGFDQGSKEFVKTKAIVENLAKSLLKLQTNMVKSIEGGLRSGWKILQGEQGEKFQLAKGGREWELTVVDVNKIRRQLSKDYGTTLGPDAAPRQALGVYKESFIKREQSQVTSKSDIAAKVERWLSRVSPEDLAKFSETTKSLAEQVKSGKIGSDQLASVPALDDIYKATVLEAKAIDDLRKQFFKTIAIPAARLSSQGTLGVETKYGAERSLASFATITTGLERLAAEFKSLGGSYQDYLQQMSKITKLPFRPDPVSQPERVKEAGDLASTLIEQVKAAGGQALVHEGLREAVQLRMTERGMPTQGFETTNKSLAGLESQAKKLGVTSLDVANALNQVNYDNFYDILDRLYQVGKTPFITQKAKGISGAEGERSVRQIAAIKDELLGIMPLVAPGRPKRRAYDEEVVKILTRKVQSASPFSATLRPEEQKKHVVDVALAWQEMADNARKLGRTGLYANVPGLGIPEAKPIDLSDSASSQIKEFSSTSTSALRDLNKTVVSASTAGIRGLAPFEKFSSISRQMSYSANALAGALPKGHFELPSLVSGRERGNIEAGKYGTGGYGLNVLTELRSTAATYEDQIVVSGRLAEAFTRIVKPLVGPAASMMQDISSMKGGKIVGATARGKALDAGVKGISPKDFEKLIGKVTSDYQEVLGVPKSYQGRADIAQISDEVKNVMRVHRGESIEVQTAKLSETFLNYFGRKLSTRFGTKGVSVSADRTQLPEGISSLEDVSSFMEQGFKAKVSPGTGLGVAKMPKSAGELLSKMLTDAMGERLGSTTTADALKPQLIASGNKFIVDLFKTAGMVTEDEAKKQRSLFEKASMAFKATFGEELPTGIAGIEKIKKSYSDIYGKEKLTTIKPIEARISARGVAKRGLMPEVLEGIVNNLIGSIKESTTILDADLTADPRIREKLNDYLKALAYSGLKGAEQEAVTKRLRSEGASEEEISKLKEFEKQWSVYTDVVDEYGKAMKSFVAPKFLQIVEEPHQYKEWSQGDITKGIKGEKLNFQAFAAYAGVFGEGSQMMEELSKATSLTSREGWELIRALQMIDPAMKDVAKSMTKGLQSVQLKDVADFTDRTAEIGDLTDTIFDVGKFPSPFKLKIPSTMKGGIGQYEDIYVPGPAARTTYPEELMGGQVSPTDISRRLSNVVSAAKRVEDIANVAQKGDLSLDDEGMRKFANVIRGELTEALTSTYKEFAGIEQKRTMTPANIDFMRATVDKFKQSLSTTRNVSSIYGTAEAKKAGLSRPQTELEAVESYERQLTHQDPGKLYSKLLARIMDILIGAQPEALKAEEDKITTALKQYKEQGSVPAAYQKQFGNLGKFYGNDFEKMMEGFQKRVEQRKEAKAAFDVELEAGNLQEFSDKVGINLQMTVKDSLERALQSLSRAKISYTEELAKQVIGPKHAIEQTFFQRTIPFSVTAKAVTAVTDKTTELNRAISMLEGSSDKSFSGIIKNLKKVRDEHEKYIEKAKKMGMPVLKEGEIGIHPEMAKQIKLKQSGRESDLSKLISDQLEEAFVTTVRYPFTGILSVQPHKAKLMEEGLSRHTLAVPGAPEMNISALEEGVIKPLEERLKELVGKREQVWGGGGEDAPVVVAALSKEIEGLIKLIRDITPKYSNMEQKLDFDGDALFLHTGQVEASRMEIKKHFEALGSDITSVRSLFNTLFTAVGGEEVDVKALSEMAYVFSKKQPEEKGFSFLEKPYIEKEVKNLNLNEVFKALLSYKKGVDIGEYLKSDVLPEVFIKAGGTKEEREMFTKKAVAGGGNVPIGPDAGEFEKLATQLLDQMSRRKLWEQKYSDAIVGQLYKLQTGQTVEGISRVARLTELETGFGTGLAGTSKRKFEPAKEFLEKWPKESIALGDKPVEEFAARMNEILRFVIQKGLDEKHAGVEAVGKNIIANVGKEGGAVAIMKIMEEEDDQFKDLHKFNEKITQSAKIRLGKHPTEALREELKRFQPDMTEDVLSGFSREDLIAQITKQVDLSAVFEELFRMIKRQAIKGYTKELRTNLEEMPIERRAKLESEVARVGGFKPYATKKITDISKSDEYESGVSILKYVTTNLEPLYKMRTSMETTGSIAGRTGMRPEIDMLLPGGDQEAKRLKATYENTLKTAHVLSRSMEGIVAGAQGGAHAMMVLSSVQKRLMELDMLAKKAEELGVPMAPGAPMPERRMDLAGGAYRTETPALFADVWEKANLSQMRLGPIKKDINPLEDMQDSLEKLRKVKKQAKSEIESMSQALGIPMMGTEEEQKSFFEFNEANKDVLRSIDLRSQSFADMISTSQPEIPQEQVESATEEYTAFMKDLLKFQISMSEQARRISEAMKAVPFQKTYLEQAFPGISKQIGKAPTDIANEMASMEGMKSKEFDKDIVAKRERRIEDIQDWFAKQKTSTAQSLVDSMVKDQPQIIPSRDFDDKIRQAAQDSITQIAATVNESVVYRTRQALKGFEKATGGPAAGGIEVPMSELYRASGLAGGGGYGEKGYGSVPQPEAIMKQMLGLGDESMMLEATAFRGTALHRRKQLEMGKKFKKFGGFEVEGLARYAEEGQDLMTGHFDVIYKESEDAQKRLADIKTIYSDNTFNALVKLSERIKTGVITLDTALEQFEGSSSNFDKSLAARIRNYISQVNFYLQSNQDAIGELIIVSSTDPTKEADIELGKFDTALFAKDIKEVKRAKEQVRRLLEVLGKTDSPEVIKSLLSDYDNIYEDLVSKLGNLTFEKVSAALPTRPTFEAMEQTRLKSWEAFANTLSKEDQNLFEQLSAEYVTAFERMRGPKAEQSFKKWKMAGVPAGAAGGMGAPPPPGGIGGAGGGDGFDDGEYEELKKRIQAILNRLNRGVDIGDTELIELMQLFEEARTRFRAIMGSDDAAEFAALAKQYDQLSNEVKQSVTANYKDGFESASNMLKLHKQFTANMAKSASMGEDDFSSFRDLDIETINPKSPLGMHKNLKALFTVASRRHGLSNIDMERFGPDIIKLIESVTTGGPSADISREIIAAVDALPKAQRGYTIPVWKHYRKAVSQYFVNELDRLKDEINNAKTEGVATEAFGEYEHTLKRFRETILKNLGKSSDIYTEKGFGGSKQMVEPELADLTGLYRTKEEIAEIARAQSMLSGEFKPIVDMLIGDADAEDIGKLVSPIEKVREAFELLTIDAEGLKKSLRDDDAFRRFGDQLAKQWDFSKVVEGITQIRAAVESWNRMQVAGFGDVGPNPAFSEAQRKNIEETIKLLRQLEKAFVPTGGAAASDMGMVGVPNFLATGEQEALHRRNIAQARSYFATPKEEGGPERGQAFSYKYKIVDPSSKQVISNMAEEFRSLGTTVDSAGNKMGVFSQKTNDLLKQFQNKQGFGQAFGRVIRWGLASGVVYGSVKALQGMVGVVTDVESSIAVLRQVMSPLETDFNSITMSAVNFAKEFGQPINQVIDSMRVFAQQGLSQKDVIDRTRTSSLAANVTTLTAADATEALTAATKVYGNEGQTTLKFLDAWSQVESRHAIISADLANALKKAAAAAKTSGVDFDQLNAIITGIGETSRQSGKEIGTSLRFMFRRLQGTKGPQELGKQGIPVLGPEGDIRSGFDILGDLASKWDELNQSQRLALAQSIGGRRHYNSLIILMDHWSDVLDTLQDSINSKGAAERRNAIIMDTYAKKLQQVRAAMVELQLQFGKFALPIAKASLTGLKLLIEIFTNIPTSVKVAFTAIASFFALISKGGGILDKISMMFTSSGNIFGDFFATAKGELSKGVYEIFGKGIGGFSLGKLFEGANIDGLKQFTEATSMKDLESGLGKSVYLMSKLGRSWNNFLTDLTKGSASATNKVSKIFDFIGDKLVIGGSILSKKGGPVGAITGAITAALGSATEMAGYGTEKVAKLLGLTAEQMAKLTRSSTGVVGALGPMIGSFFALKPLVASAWDGFKKLALSAGDYEKSISGLRMLHAGELESIKDLSYEYDKLDKKLADISQSMQPGVKVRQQSREEYKSPLHELGKLYGNAIDYGNKLADVNLDLISGFDQFGNAILRTTGNMKGYVNVLEAAQHTKMAETELGVLGAYAKDLTKTTGLESFKNEFKKFLAEIPVIGEMLAKSIKVSPAKSIEDLRKKMENLVELRNKYPLTTSFDVDLTKYNDQLATARELYKETYNDFTRTLGNIPTEGLNPAQISEMFSRPEFKEGFQVIADIEPRLQTKALKGKVDWQDVLGAEVLKKVHPGKPLDFTGALTKGLLEQSNIKPRDAEAFAGDIVLFTDKIADKYEMAGDQAILKMQKTSEGVVKWTVQYFDKELLAVKETPFDKVSKFVDAIFPVQAISDRLYENIEVLKEFVAGAGAGLRGITEKTFKKDFNLGERFFSQLPTTTLLQTSKGYEPGQGFGEVPFKTGWDKWIDANFFKPMTEYTQLLEQLKPADLPTGESEISPGLSEDISALQEVLKNNQVVLQYRAAHEDLIKSMSEGNRVLKENIAAERNRSMYIVQTSGYLKGFTEDMADINLGVKKYTDLTAQQRLAFSELGGENKPYTTARTGYKEDALARQSMVDSITNIDKSLIAVREIGDVARSFGAALPTQDLSNYIEEIAKTGDRGTGLLLGETKKVESNTAATVDRLDQMLEQGGDTAAIKRIVERTSGRSDIINKLESLTEKRNKAAKKDNTDLVITYDRSIDKLTSKLVDTVGPEKALKYVGKNAPFFGTQDYTQAEFVKRSLGNTNFEGFSKALERVQPGITKTKEFTKLINLQKEQSTEQVVSNKNLQKLLAIYSTIEHFNKVSSNRQIKAIDNQLGELETQRKEAQKTGAPTEAIASQIQDLTTVRGELSTKASGQAMREIIAPIALASQELAKSFGVTDRQMRILGGSVGGAYLAWQAWNKLTGEPIPEYLKELGKESAEAAQRMAKEGVSGKAWRTYYGAKDLVFGKNLDEKLHEAEKKIKEEQVLTKEEQRQTTESVVYGQAPTITDPRRLLASGVIEGSKSKTTFLGDLGTKIKDVMSDPKKFGALKDDLSRIFSKYGQASKSGGRIGPGGLFTEDTKKLQDKIKEGTTRILREYGITAEEEMVIYGGEKAEDSEVRRSGKAQSMGQMVRRAVEYSKAQAKARPAEDKILDENSAQTGILHGIYEQTKRTAENTHTFSDNLSQEINAGKNERQDEVSGILTNVDKLRGEYLERSGTRVSPLKQIVAAMLAATSVGYVSERSGQQRRNNELENRAGDQIDILENIIDKYPDVISKAISDFNTTIVAAGDGITVETEKVQKAVDTESAEKDMVSRLEELRDKMTTAYEGINESMEESARRISELELAEEMKKQLEDLDNAIKSSMAIKNLEERFGVATSGVMAGKRVPQISLGTQNILDLSPNESLTLKKDYSRPILGAIKHTVEGITGGVSTIWQTAMGVVGTALNTITLGVFEDTYSDLAKQYEEGTSELSQLMSAASSITTEMTGIRSAPMTDESEARYEALEDNLGKITDRIGDLNESLIKTSIGLQSAIAAEELHIQTLKTAAEASAQFASSYVQATTPTNPFSYLGSRGLGTGGLNLQLPRTAEDMTDSERALLEARKAGNAVIEKSMQNYAAVTGLISGQNQQLQEHAAKISNLRINYREQSNELGQHSDQAKAAKAALEAEVKAHKELKDSMSKNVEALKAFGTSMTALNFGTLINKFEGLKRSYLETSRSIDFKRLTEGVDKIFGGSHPLAKVAPTYAALQAGVPEDQLLNMNKYQLQRAEMYSQIGPGPTIEQLNAASFGQKVDKWAHEQGIQNAELSRQREQAGQYNEAFARAMRSAEGRGDKNEIESLKKIWAEFTEESKTMATVERVDEGGVEYYQGVDFEKYKKGTSELFKTLGIGNMEDMVAKPIVTSIETNTGKLIEALGGTDPYKKAEPGILSRIVRFFGFSGAEESPVEKKQSGGFVKGPGGPREDRVFTTAMSPGEYVVKERSARDVGADALNYINDTGKLPTFVAGGGMIRRYADGGSDSATRSFTNIGTPGGRIYEGSPNMQMDKYDRILGANARSNAANFEASSGSEMVIDDDTGLLRKKVTSKDLQEMINDVDAYQASTRKFEKDYLLSTMMSPEDIRKEMLSQNAASFEIRGDNNISRMWDGMTNMPRYFFKALGKDLASSIDYLKEARHDLYKADTEGTFATALKGTGLAVLEAPMQFTKLMSDMGGMAATVVQGVLSPARTKEYLGDAWNYYAKENAPEFGKMIGAIPGAMINQLKDNWQSYKTQGDIELPVDVASLFMVPGGGAKVASSLSKAGTIMGAGRVALKAGKFGAGAGVLGAAGSVEGIALAGRLGTKVITGLGKGAYGAYKTLGGDEAYAFSKYMAKMAKEATMRRAARPDPYFGAAAGAAEKVGTPFGATAKEFFKGKYQGIKDFMGGIDLNKSYYIRDIIKGAGIKSKDFAKWVTSKKSYDIKGVINAVRGKYDDLGGYKGLSGMGKDVYTKGRAEFTKIGDSAEYFGDYLKKTYGADFASMMGKGKSTIGDLYATGSAKVKSKMSDVFDPVNILKTVGKGAARAVLGKNLSSKIGGFGKQVFNEKNISWLFNLYKNNSDLASKIFGKSGVKDFMGGMRGKASNFKDFMGGMRGKTFDSYKNFNERVKSFWKEQNASNKSGAQGSWWERASGKGDEFRQRYDDFFRQKGSAKKGWEENMRDTDPEYYAKYQKYQRTAEEANTRRNAEQAANRRSQKNGEDIREALRAAKLKYGVDSKEYQDLFNEFVNAYARNKSGAVPNTPGTSTSKKDIERFLLAGKFSKGGLSGIVHGPGGPKEDRVAAFLSPNEYVVNAAATKNVGVRALDYINERGELPTFAAEGGLLKGYKDGGKVLASKDYQAAHHYLTTDEEDIKEPKFNKEVAKYLIERIGKRKELDAYLVSEELRKVGSWKDFYNILADLGDTNEELSNEIFNTIPKPVVKDKKSAGYNLKGGMKALSGKTRSDQLREINKVLDGKHSGGIIKGYAEGGYAAIREQFGKDKPKSKEELAESRKDLLNLVNISPPIAYALRKLGVDIPQAEPETVEDVLMNTMFGAMGSTKLIGKGIGKVIGKVPKTTDEVIKYMEKELKSGTELTIAGRKLGDSMKTSGSKLKSAELLRDARIEWGKRLAPLKETNISQWDHESMKGQAFTEGIEQLVRKASTKKGLDEAKNITTEFLKSGKLPEYKAGIAYVPQDQLAYLHEGERVTPKNLNNTKSSEGIDAQEIGASIGESIISKLDQFELKLKPVELAQDTVEISEASIESLSGAIAKVNSGVTASVGAEEATTKIDDFIDAANSRFETFAVKMDEQDVDIKVLNTSVGQVVYQIESIDVAAISAKLEKVHLTIDNMVTKDELNVKTSNSDSKVDYKIHEAINYIEERYLTGIRTDISIANGQISDVKYDLADTKDKVDMNASRAGFNI